jgi:sulfate transport system substrate-binding protein
VVLGALPALLLPALAACGGTGSGASADGSLPAAQLALVAYSTPQEPYQKIEAAFQKTPAGKNITFSESYGASGDQSRAVDSGLPADIVAFSLEPDMTRLVKSGWVDAGWNSDQYRGMVTQSVVVIGSKKGNPRNIRTWDDLTQPGVQVITPNPFTSGGARWNVMAAYGAKSNVGRDDASGQAYLNDLFSHVPVQDDSARKSLTTFTGGKGDAFISYQNEAIFAQQHAQSVDYVIPDQSILIENPVAVTKKSKHPQQARAFLDFLHAPEAQRIFADAGYRPVLAGVARDGEFKDPAQLFTIKDLGGWTAVNTKFFDANNGVLVAVERRLGVSTTK